MKGPIAGVCFLIFVLTSISEQSFGKPKLLVFFDNAVANDTYIPSNKEKQIKFAFNLAVEDLKQQKTNCRLSSNLLVNRSGPLEVFKQKNEVEQLSITHDIFLAGLIHSSETLLAAKAFKDSSFIALSSGAASDRLKDANHNFFSLANSFTEYADLLKMFIRSRSLFPVAAVYPGESLYASEFVKVLERSLDASIPFKATSVDHTYLQKNYASIQKLLKNVKAVFVPGFIQETLPIIEALKKLNYSGAIIGSPNWARSMSDLKLFTKKLNLSNNQIYMLASWTSGESNTSKRFEHRFSSKFGSEVMGTAIYTYDATIIGGSFLCSGSKLTSDEFINYANKHIINKKYFPTVRTYTSIKDGHFLSDTKLIKYINKTGKFEILDKL